MFRLFFTKLSNNVLSRKSGRLFYSVEADLCGILVKHLGLNTTQAESVVNMKSQLLRVPQWRVKINCIICQEMNIKLAEAQSLATCLFYTSMELEHRICLLQEMGLKDITVTHIHRLYEIMNESVNTFKKKHRIPADENIVRNIFNSIGGSIGDTSHLENLSEDLRLKEHYTACMEHYMKWDLQYYGKTIFTYQGIKYKSFRMITEVLQVLTNDVKCTVSMIENAPFLLDTSERIVRIFQHELKNVTVAGKELNEIIHKWPFFLFYDVNNIKKLLETFKKYNIEDRSVYRCLEIFKHKNKKIVQRMTMIENDPDLRIWSKHPRILYLVNHFYLAKTRVKLLRMAGRIKTANFHSITAVKTFFQRLIRDETSHASQKIHVDYIIRKELGNVDLFKFIKRHPYWKTVPLADIDQNLQYLKQSFSVDDIASGIFVIFYPRSAVEEALKKVRTEYTPEKGYNFTPAQELKLCVYLLEKNNHFTGDAIWHTKSSEEESSTMPSHIDISEMKKIRVH